MSRNMRTELEGDFQSKVKFFPWSSTVASEDTKSSIVGSTPFEIIEANCIQIRLLFRK